ncbi:uncharacterized protein LOC136065142 [Quercus suber]|uniref:uncharacterized protein LOC136065142 n=1 Tax=Quercus suber TaxID=58331 RepID=UPI0032DFE2F9
MFGPNVELTSITVKNLRYSNSPSPSFNATMVAKMSIKNMNFWIFQFLGILKLSSHAQFSGTISSMKIIKNMKIAKMSCTLSLNLTSGGLINNLICQ